MKIRKNRNNIKSENLEPEEINPGELKRKLDRYNQLKYIAKGIVSRIGLNFSETAITELRNENELFIIKNHVLGILKKEEFWAEICLYIESVRNSESRRSEISDFVAEELKLYNTEERLQVKEKLYGNRF